MDQLQQYTTTRQATRLTACTGSIAFDTAGSGTTIALAALIAATMRLTAEKDKKNLLQLTCK